MADVDARLHLLATRLVMDSTPWVDDAVELACALVAADRDTPATVQVCALYRGTSFAEAEPLLRAMLLEQGLAPLPADPSDEQRQAYVVEAFRLGMIEVDEFCQHLYGSLPAWDDQSAVQRRVLRLLDDWENEHDPGRRRSLVERMRRAVGADTLGAG